LLASAICAVRLDTVSAFGDVRAFSSNRVSSRLYLFTKFGIDPGYIIEVSAKEADLHKNGEPII